MTKTINIGTHTKKQLKEAIKKDFNLGTWAEDIFDSKDFTIGNEETINLVITTVEELGFTKSTSLKEIYEAAIKKGYELCPAEVGPQLRLQYPDQPKNEWLIIGMEPIRDSLGYLDVFYVGHDGGGRWLGSFYGDPDGVWDPDDRFVFVSRKSLEPGELSTSPSEPLDLEKRVEALEATVSKLTKVINL